MKPVYGESRVRPDMAGNFESYQRSLASAGVKRRNTAELEDAWLQSRILDWVPTVAMLRNHSPLSSPVVPPLPKPGAIRARAISDLKKQGSYRAFRRGNRGERQAAVAALISELETRRVAYNEKVKMAFDRYKALDPVINLLVFQAAFADNEVTAVPVELDGDALLVIMSVPGPKEVVWPEEATLTPAGKKSVKKRSRADLDLRYLRWMICQVIGTCREAFLLQPAFSTCRIVVLLEEAKALPTRKVLLDGVFDRDRVLNATTTASDEWELSWDRLVDSYMAGQRDNTQTAWTKFMSHAKALDRIGDQWQSLLGGTTLKVTDNLGVASIGSLASRLPERDLSRIIRNDGASIRSVLPPVAENPDALGLADFWVACLEDPEQRSEAAEGTPNL